MWGVCVCVCVCVKIYGAVQSAKVMQITERLHEQLWSGWVRNRTTLRLRHRLGQEQSAMPMFLGIVA